MEKDTGAVRMFLDSPKAFDTIHRCILLDKDISMLYRLSMGCHTVSPAPVWVRIPGP